MDAQLVSILVAVDSRLPRSDTPGKPTPARARVLVRLALSSSSSMRVLERVHGHSTHVRADTEVARPTGLSEIALRMVLAIGRKEDDKRSKGRVSRRRLIQ